MEKKKPPVNSNGQVLGEHVQFVSPCLDNNGRMVIYDVWPKKNQPFHKYTPINRDLFHWQVILVIRND